MRYVKYQNSLSVVCEVIGLWSFTEINHLELAYLLKKDSVFYLLKNFPFSFPFRPPLSEVCGFPCSLSPSESPRGLARGREELSPLFPVFVQSPEIVQTKYFYTGNTKVD